MPTIKEPIFCTTRHDILDRYKSQRDCLGGLEYWYFDEENPVFYDSLGQRLGVKGDEGSYEFYICSHTDDDKQDFRRLLLLSMRDCIDQLEDKADLATLIEKHEKLKL